MIVLMHIAIVVFVVYAVITISKFGIPKSVSDTYYLWKESGKGKWYTETIFIITLFLVGFLPLPYWVEVSPTNIQFLPFLSCSGLVFVGAACAFKQELTKSVHYASAGVWAVGNIVWNVVCGNWIGILSGLVVALAGMVINRSNNLFWLEIGCVVIMIIGFFL